MYVCMFKTLSLCMYDTVYYIIQFSKRVQIVYSFVSINLKMYVCMYVLYVCMNKCVHITDEVRDTTGAGDAFIGGFLVALLTQSHTYMSLTRGSDSEQKKDDLFDEELVVLLRCLQFGSLVAAEAIQGIGAR